MKRIIVITIFVGLLAHEAFTQKGLSKKIDEFHTLQVYHGIFISLERSDVNELVILNDEVSPEDIELTINDGIVRIRKNPQGSKPEKISLRLKYTSIKSIEAYNNSEISTDNLITSDSLFVSLKSGADLFADLDIKYLEAKLVEGALLSTDGYAVFQKVNVSTNATYSGMKCIGDEGEIIASMNAIAKVNIEKKLNANAKTKGYIRYMEGPKVDSKTSLGGVVEPQFD